MTELERALAALGRELDFPAEPDLRSGVRERIHRRPRRRRVLVLAAAAVLAGLAVALAVPEARSAILRFFHIGSVTIERVETLPAARERSLTAGLGPRLSLKDAEAKSGLQLILPGSRPTRFYAMPGLIATVLHSHGQDVLLAEVEGDQTGIAKKIAGRDTLVEPADVRGWALWLEGGRHILIWQLASGEGRQLERRFAGNVLIWTVGDRTFRLEGALDKSQMVALGRQITR